MLIGHSVGLDDSYFRPNEKQILEQYCKAINDLTINEENRLRTENQIMKKKQDTFDSRLQSLEELFYQRQQGPTDNELLSIYHSAIKIQLVNQRQK